MNESVLVLGGDLFSLIAAKVLKQSGLEVTWVSCRSGQESYGRELNRTLSHHPEMTNVLKFCVNEQEATIESLQRDDNIEVLESVKLINILDNGSFVDVRLNVDDKIKRLRCHHLICINRYFALQKKLRLEYGASTSGPTLPSNSVSRCHFMGEVSFLYFDQEQIPTWFEQLNRFIKTLGHKRRKPLPENRLKAVSPSEFGVRR